MKKQIALSVLLCLLLCLSLSGTALAQESEMTLGYVTDAANLFTESQVAALNDAATQVSSEYHCAI